MKKFVVLLLPALVSIASVRGQSYSVSGSKTWTQVIGSGSCWSCTITLASGATLTLDQNVTCGTCTISGGTISMAANFTFQGGTLSNLTLNQNGFNLSVTSSLITFQSSTINLNTAGYLLANGPINITNSTLNATGKAYFSNNSSTFNASGSNFYFYDYTYFTANGGPVNLKSNSHFFIGDGTTSSTAYFYLNGPALTISDNQSGIVIANKNNYYFNWSSYHSGVTGLDYSTSSNSYNCGTSGMNACKAPYVYGCASLTYSGVTVCSTLATTFVSFLAQPTAAGDVNLSWTVATETGVTGYTVQHSSDSAAWDDIARVSAGAFDGEYHAVDRHADMGKNFYRIAMIGVEGPIGFSDVRLADLKTEPGNARLFPNPAAGGRFHVQLSAAATGTVNLLGPDGRLMATVPFQAQNDVAVDLTASGASGAGMLFVQVSTPEKTWNFQLLVQH